MCRGAVAVSVVLAIGCGSPHLAYYRASPRRFCPKTQEVRIEWFSDAKSVELTGFGEQEGRGSVPLRPPRAASITLDYGNKTDHPVQKIEPMTSESSLVGDRAITCRDGIAIAEVDFEPGEYAPEVIVKSLKNRLDDRDIHIVHVGREVTVPASTEVPLPELEANDPTVRTARTWTIRVPLREGETCDAKRVIHPAVVMNLECAR